MTDYARNLNKVDDEDERKNVATKKKLLEIPCY